MSQRRSTIFQDRVERTQSAPSSPALLYAAKQRKSFAQRSQMKVVGLDVDSS